MTRPPPLVDWAAVRNMVRFVARGPRRHPAVALLAFVLTLAATGAFAAFAPRRYHASTKLLVHPIDRMAALVSPNRPLRDEAPTRAAREQVLAHDSLKKIALETDLVAQWRVKRSPVLRQKDQLQQLIGGAWSDEVWTEIVVGTLEKRLLVASDAETVEISVEWPDPEMARRIVETAAQSFVETRYVKQVEAIGEAIGILELHVSQTRGTVDEALENLRRVVTERSRGDTRILARASATPRSRPVTSQELAQLSFTLRSTQVVVARLEEQRRREIARTRATLGQQAVIYNRSHPVLSQLEQRLKQLERDSPELAQLKRDVHELQRDLEVKGGKPDRPQGFLPAEQESSGLVAEGSLASLAPELERDPAISVAQEQVRVALSRYQELLMHAQVARLALDTARSAFKQRFDTVRPAQTPKEPTSPNLPAVIGAGLMLAVVLAFFATYVLDAWRGTLSESWQVERQLGIAVLVTMKEPPA